MIKIDNEEFSYYGTPFFTIRKTSEYNGTTNHIDVDLRCDKIDLYIAALKDIKDEYENNK